ncbi:disease resistance protein RPV1-like [Rosa rugosa]|uniref:disease resistance protein RPV1-like n=1 Tax=Rosa rugosa TaxID=74645 RepID=UPI002B4004C8|nr:disease resistance protein RPV1-like [Rosa rugosa]XP_061991613.1 disease resistance protein RPV1-like [Rosa rugosa]XP_061991614.1 disease resistance protein RPV1-like [Rosa rugosa]XP_061991616.1 disease resistance protein RPV1-like [Rosa rugosa]XP_061991617.1 disease resistance protein RPV1-like [Rosa rugosa]XP_061991618.1 disease resistance protein RPV1-like [Rosa rugosa]
MVIIEEASSSSSTHPWKYHVFLSFRGEDTRYNFTDHLYNALCREGIITFMDDQLRRGEEISTELLQAIDQSRISIIVFSKNYASSKWCLEELVKILDCKKSNQQEVRPVFYKVDPSDIRNHRGSFGEALANHECKFKDNPDKVQVQKWKSALSEAAKLSGWTLSEHQSEFRFIHDIVGEISKQLIKRTYLNVATYPVGIEPRAQEIHELLGVEGRDVHMVGIWGTGGIGKTTIAKDVYNSIAHEFEGSCFLENVRENSMLDRGFIKLQKKLLFEILGGTKLKVANVAGGITMIKERLQYKRVLLVLDDVNDMDQLKNLAGKPSWFGKGSKIIITTRDKKLLRDHSDLIYEVEELNHDEALELISMNAFQRSRPLDGYAKLTERAVCYAKGLPLALTILGSSLCNESVEQWEAALDGFKSSKIQDVLKISYNGLDHRVKEAFLDIACFFKGENREHVIKILEACGSKKHDIDVLIEKALISIRDGDCIRMHGDCIWMHDLVEEMGRDIVHELSPNNPGKRSRLWFHEDVYRVLTENIGTTNVIGIKVQLPEDSDVIYLSGTTFSNMPNLRLFIYRSGRYAGVVDNLPNSLRVLDWPDCDLQFLPSNSIPRELGLINMPRSCITGLEVGYKHLKNLTSINLSYCQYLTKVSDLSGSPNLQHLDLSHCKNLVEVDRSVGFLNKLDYLSLWSCPRLETFPTEVSWKSMRELLLGFCKRLENFINIVHKMESIKTLSLPGSGIKELHSCIGRCTTLEVLCLTYGTSIKQFPSSIGNLTSLVELDASETLIEELPSSIGSLTSLRKLMLSKTPIKELPSSIGNLTSLVELDASKTLIEVLPSSIGHLTSLKRLKLSKTPIKELPSSIGYLTSLKKLYMSETHIKELPSSIGYLTSLKELYMSETHIKELPSSIGYLTSLKELDMSETRIEELPSSIGHLTSLKELMLSKTLIKELPSSIGNLTSLYILDVSKTPIKELPSSIGNFTSLNHLDASETMIEELPLSIKNLFGAQSGLQPRLKLKGCANLRTVPHSVYGGLQELNTLDLSWCPKLVTFPSRASALVSSSAESLPPMLPTNSDNGHDHPGSSLFPELTWLYFDGCKLSVSDFLTNLDCASALQTLNLSGSSFDSLPACISKFHLLRYLDLSGCKRLRDISELPPNIRFIKLDDCVSLERFSKLSNILEQKDTLGLLDTMYLSNCNRLMDNLGMDVVSKMAKALLNQLVLNGRGWFDCWKLVLPSLPRIEVPKWFNGGAEATSVLSGISDYDICEILIKIPRNLKGERIRMVVCVVLEITQDFSGACDVTVVINKERYSGGLDYDLPSAHDNVYVCLTCIDFMELEVVDHEVRVNFRYSRGKRLLLKSFGVHLANMQENDDDQVSGEYSARERYRQSNACISDFENEEGAAVASLVSDDSSSGEVDDDHHDGEQEPHPPTERFEDLTRQTNIGRAMLAFLRCFGITTCL